MSYLPPQSIHFDARYQTVETIGAWEIRSVPYTDPSYTSYFRADCLPVQLLHRATGLSILTATRRTCGKFEVLVPESLQGKTLVAGCPRRARGLIALRSATYQALKDAIKAEFGIIAPEYDAFATYSLMDRPGPKEAAGFNAA